MRSVGIPITLKINLVLGQKHQANTGELHFEGLDGVNLSPSGLFFRRTRSEKNVFSCGISVISKLVRYAKYMTCNIFPSKNKILEISLQQRRKLQKYAYLFFVWRSCVVLPYIGSRTTFCEISWFPEETLNLTRRRHNAICKQRQPFVE